MRAMKHETDEFDRIDRGNAACGRAALIGTALAFVLAYIIVFCAH